MSEHSIMLSLNEDEYYELQSLIGYAWIRAGLEDDHERIERIRHLAITFRDQAGPAVYLAMKARADADQDVQTGQGSVYEWSWWQNSRPSYPYHYPLEWRRDESEPSVMMYPPDAAWNIGGVSWRKLRT